MEMLSIEKELQGNSYPGRGIIIGKSADGTKAVTAYFIMGRSENSRNRVFVEEGEGIRTQAFDPSKLTDPSLIIYAPVRVLGNKTIVTNGDQTDTIYEGMDKQLTMVRWISLIVAPFVDCTPISNWISPGRIVPINASSSSLKRSAEISKWKLVIPLSCSLM